MKEHLFIELQKLSEKNHYLDVSEQVRSVVRDKWMEAKDPQSYQIKKLRRDIAHAVKTKTEEGAQKQLIAELERIKEGILSAEKR